jgi:ribosome maturation factor RimP
MTILNLLQDLENAFLLVLMIQDELIKLLTPTIESMGYELWGCEYLAQGKHSLLRIYIDKSEGIGIDDCQAVSKQVSALLDVEDPIQGNYSLEISSPGIPRPLFNSSHYQQYAGQPIQVKTLKPINGKRKFLGTIASVSDSSVVLNINGEQQELFFSNIVKASLID